MKPLPQMQPALSRSHISRCHIFVDDQTQPGNVAEDTGPLSQSDLIGMFINQVPEAQVVAEDQKRGQSAFKADQGMN